MSDARATDRIGSVLVLDGDIADQQIREVAREFAMTSALPGEEVHAVGYGRHNGADVPAGSHLINDAVIRDEQVFYRFAGVEGDYPADFFYPETEGENQFGVLIGRAGDLFFVPLSDEFVEGRSLSTSTLSSDRPAFRVDLSKLNRIGLAAFGLPCTELTPYGYAPAHSTDSLIAELSGDPNCGEFYFLSSRDGPVLHASPWCAPADAGEIRLAHTGIDRLLAAEAEARAKDSVHSGPHTSYPLSFGG